MEVLARAREASWPEKTGDGRISYAGSRAAWIGGGDGYGGREEAWHTAVGTAGEIGLLSVDVEDDALGLLAVTDGKEGGSVL